MVGLPEININKFRKYIEAYDCLTRLQYSPYLNCCQSHGGAPLVSFPLESLHHDLGQLHLDEEDMNQPASEPGPSSNSGS